MITRPRTARRIRTATVGLLGLSAVLFAGGGLARADGYLTPGEQQLASTVSPGLCAYIDSHGVTSSSMKTVFNAIYPAQAIGDGGDVADVVIYAVETYCPEHWRELLSFGSGYGYGQGR